MWMILRARDIIRTVRFCGVVVAAVVAFGHPNVLRAQLAGANLQGCDLRRADLRDASLIGADLTRADLGADSMKDVVVRLPGSQMLVLDGTDLRRADLRRATLFEAKLLGANLRGADLRDTDLRRAALAGAILKGADLQGARLDGASVFQVLAQWLGPRMRSPTEWAVRADFRGARNLTCEQLSQAAHWEQSFRDPGLACGRPIPQLPGGYPW